MKHFILAVSLLTQLLTAAPAKTVSCTYEGETNFAKGKLHNIFLKVGSNGEIEQWDEKRWAQVTKGKLLQVFAQDYEEYGFEWSKTFIARNGYTALELGTTADVFVVGVNAKAGKGFYRYRDIGSGAGNYQFELECHEVK